MLLNVLPQAKALTRPRLCLVLADGIFLNSFLGESGLSVCVLLLERGTFSVFLSSLSH